MTPLVSIIITAYNARRWVKKAVDSALGQSYRNCEVLVIDDGSTDGSGEWLKRQYDSRICLLCKSNGGLSSARNVGLRYAKGKYVQFLDADDWILPDKVAIHVDYLEKHPEVDVVYGHALYCHDGSIQELREWPRQALYRSGHIFSSMVDYGYLMTHMTMSRRECLERVGGFDESLTSCVDWDFWLRVAYAGATFFYLEGPPMAVYRVRKDRQSRADITHALNGLRVLSKVANYVQDPGERRRIRLRRAQGHWRFKYGETLLEAGQRCRGLGEMTRSILADPSYLDHKLSLIMLCLVMEFDSAHRLLNRLKNAKNHILRRQAPEFD